MKSSESSNQYTIPQMKSNNFCKYLEIKSTLQGYQKSQFETTLDTAKLGARLLTSNPFNRKQSKLYLLIYVTPKITNQLSCDLFSSSQYSTLYEAITPTATSSIEFNWLGSIKLQHGKHLYGGLQLKNCEVEALILKIKGLQSLLSKKESSKLAQILLMLF